MLLYFEHSHKNLTHIHTHKIQNVITEFKKKQGKSSFVSRLFKKVRIVFYKKFLIKNGESVKFQVGESSGRSVLQML